MNSESLNLLSQKVDGVLTTVRNLRQEAANLKQALAQANSELQDKAMLLETANASLVDCKAALDARANQAAAQDESLVQKQAEIDNLNAKINSMTDTVESFNGQLMEKNGIIDALNGQISDKNGTIEAMNGQIAEKNGTIDALNGQIAEKNGIIDALNGQIAEKDSALQELNAKNASESESLQAQVESLRAELAGKDSAIERLNAELNDKTACIEKMGETIQAQGEEITEAQEKFKQLMDTIEKELGTEFPVCKNFEPPAAVSAAATTAAPAPAEQSTPAEQPAAAPVEEAPAAEPVKEPTVEPVDDEPVLDFNQISEDEDLPIEVHGANEKDNDLFSASNGGSQTNFFG